MSMDNDVAKAVLGQLPAALAETVSLATPLTMSRIEGRDEAAAVLRELAESLGVREQEFIANDDERAFVTFVCTGQGSARSTKTTVAIVTRGMYTLWHRKFKIDSVDQNQPEQQEEITADVDQLLIVAATLANHNKITKFLYTCPITYSC